MNTIKLQCLFLLVACLFISSDAQANNLETTFDHLKMEKQSAMTTTSLCGNGALELKITFDNNPEQIAWQIKDNQQNIIKMKWYGNTNIAPGDIITESIQALPDGDYVLVVFDSGGNGLCCTNGLGSFELSDNQNTLLDGDVFEGSSVQTFCIGTTNNDIFDLTPPTASVLTASNPTTNSVDLSWTVSTDNDAIVGYVIFVNGVYAGDMAPYDISGTFPGLSPNTTYDFFIASRDLTGNFSPKSNVVSITTLGGVTSTIIHEGYFENNSWDGWTDGGNDAHHYSGNKSYEGSGSIRLRDNSGSKSSMTSPVFDLSAADSVNITFQYYTKGFESGEDFFIKFKQGNTYVNVAQYVKGTDFTTNGFYEAKVTIDANALTLGTTDQFRVQTDASNNNDRIWVDQVIITSYTSGSISSMVLPSSIGEKKLFLERQSNTIVQTPAFETPLENASVDSNNPLSVFPNPARHSISLQGIDMENLEVIKMYDANGKLVLTTKETQNIDLKNMANGVHYLMIVNKDQVNQYIKFIKK